MTTIDLEAPIAPAVAERVEFIDRSIANVAPGSPEWYSYMTASKIAAVMGHSTYDTWFSLWHRMNGTIELQPEDDQKRRGHYLEPAIAAWWADQFPDYDVYTTGLWVHPEVEWAAASPDRIPRHKLTGAPVLLECKSDANDAFGEPGTDQVPPAYFDQVQWQMGCTGIRTAYIAVLGGFLMFDWYVVEYDAAHFDAMMARATEFMTDLTLGNLPSIDPMDGHLATYQAVKELHPDIDRGTVLELSKAEVVPYLQAVEESEAAKTRLQAATTVMADLLGNGHKVLYNSKTVAYRMSKGGGTPYLVKGKNLPAVSAVTATATDQEQAA